MQVGEFVDHPGRHESHFDFLAKVFEHLLAGLDVGLEIRVGEHGGEVVVESVELHELIVEVEGERIAIRHGIRAEVEGAQGGEIGNVHPEGVGVTEA